MEGGIFKAKFASLESAFFGNRIEMLKRCG
jgi:hypothetical protein